MRGWTLLFAFCVGAAAASPGSAQSVGARIGIGPAVGGDFGAVGLLGLDLTRGSLVLRLDGQAIAIGRSGDWEGSARVVALGAAAGVTHRHAPAGTRGYALATGSFGIDPREGDDVATIGAVLGIQPVTRPGLFVELRAEHWMQRGIVYYELPANVISLVLGLAI